LERIQFAHAGRFSSHLILLCLRARDVSATNVHPDAELPGVQRELPYLQLLHPVLTFGLLVRARFGFCAASPEASPGSSACGGIAPVMDAIAPGSSWMFQLD
jgi:hypothetical protein